MNTGVRHFLLPCCVIGMLTAGVYAETPTMSLRLGGINDVQFREIDCSANGNADCPSGSVCAPSVDPFACPSLQCCTAIPNPPLGLVQPGDVIRVEAFVEGWDPTPDAGQCLTGSLPGQCSVAAQDCNPTDDCTEGFCHCVDTFRACTNRFQCPSSVECVDDACLVAPQIGTCQWSIDASTYASNQGSTLEVAAVDCSINGDEDCRHGFTATNQCTCFASECDVDTGLCDVEASAFIDSNRFDYLFKSKPSISATSFATEDYKYASAITSGINGAVDDGTIKYLGTLLLQVPEGACGTFVLDMLRSPQDTFVSDSLTATRLPGPVFETLTVPLGSGSACDPPDCDDGDLCTVDTCVCGVCENTDVVCGAGEVCNPSTGECVSGCSGMTSYPPNCAIDARQPHAINDASAVQGIQQIEVSFDSGCNTDSLSDANFRVRVRPGLVLPPNISSVEPSGRCTDGSLCELDGDPPCADASTCTGDGSSALITFADPIDVSKWTCVEFLLTGEETCVGFLPGDVDGGNQTGASDIGTLVDCLNGARNCDEYVCDIDRTPPCAAADIGRLVDLLNGAGAFTPWILESISIGGTPTPCPSAP